MGGGEHTVVGKGKENGGKVVCGLVRKAVIFNSSGIIRADLLNCVSQWRGAPAGTAVVHGSPG